MKKTILSILLIAIAVVFIATVFSENEMPTDQQEVIDPTPDEPEEPYIPDIPDDPQVPDEPDEPDEPVINPATITIKKAIVGDIWCVRCDYMDGETFHAGGGIWKRDVISNPAGNLGDEGHRSNKCGSIDNWVIWVGTDGVPYRMDEIKSGATGGTLPTVLYKPRYELTDEEILSLTPEDSDMVWKYSQNFIDTMNFSDIKIGQRLYWTTQSGSRVWYHTGVPFKSSPSFVLFVNGTGYPLVAGESVEINDLLPGIYEISEQESPEFYLGEVTSSGEIESQNEWTVNVVIHDGENVSIDWPNVVITPPPKESPEPPSPPEVPTATPTLGPDETPTPTPTPTHTPTPTPSPTPTPAIELDGVKVWDDMNNKDRVRPKTITVHLYANNTLIKTVDVSIEQTTDVDGVWYYYLGEFPKYDASGDEIQYSIQEDEVRGYEIHYRGLNVINYHTTYTPRPPKPTPSPTPVPTDNPVIIPVVPDDLPQPKVPKAPFYDEEIFDYDTALGILLEINHVGDCFD